MTDMIVAAHLAKKMKSRKEFLEDRQFGKQKPDFISEWRLDSAHFIEKYYEVQELLRQRFARSAQFIPSKEYVLGIPQREKVLSAGNPMETVVCFQQGEFLVHVNYVWPKTVFDFLSAFLDGKRAYTFSFPLSMQCLAKSNRLCTREGITKKCLLNAKESITKCPVLKKRVNELCDRLEKQLSYFTRAEKMQSKTSVINWREGEKKGTYHFHTDIVPFSR